MTLSRLVVTTFEHRSGLAEDRVSNSFAVQQNESIGVGTAHAQLITAFVDFWTLVRGGNMTASPSSFLYDGVSRAAGSARVKVYDIDGKEQAVFTGGKWRTVPHGSPVAEGTFTPTGPSTTSSLPEEVAICQTLRAASWDLQPIEQADDGDADTAPQRPRQRYAGRVFYGPLINTVVSLDGTTKKTRVGQSVIDNLNAAVQQLQVQLEANGHGLAVWSRMDGDLREVVRVETDNAFDTQRRRGVKPTARTALNV